MNVTLRGLDIDGLYGVTNGINVVGSSLTNVHVENSQIYGFATGINIAPSAAANVTVANTRISECTGGIDPAATGVGINADGTGGAVSVVLINSEIHNCATGLNLAGGAKANARLTDFSQNVTGMNVSGATSIGFLDSGAIAYCTTGINVTTSGGIARFSNMTITDNTTGIATIAGGVLASFGNNRMKGNVTNGAPTTTLFAN
jgi:hypothetical protein